MPDVHPTAIVDSRAELGRDVVVGPGCIIEGEVRVGEGCKLLHRVSLRGPLTIGRRNVLYPNVCLGYAPQDRKYDSDVDGAGLVIGDENLIREGCLFHRATGTEPTRIGSGNYFMGNTHIGHDAVVGDRGMYANNAMIGGHSVIGDQVVMGGAAAVHQFCRVGRLAMISGVMGVTRDVPPFCMVFVTRRVGALNLVGLRRAGHRASIPALKKAFDLFYRRGLIRQEAVGRIEREFGDDPLCREFVDFIKASTRGVTTFGLKDGAGD